MTALAKILLADDDRATRKAFGDLLSREGYEAVRDGSEAVAAFERSGADLVLLDVMMPKTGGIAACAEIRRKDPLVPVLFFTAAPGDAGLVRALGAGGDDYIDKTRPPEEFLARIAAALRRAAAAKEPAPGRAGSGPTVCARDDAPFAEIGLARADFDSMTVKLPRGAVVKLTRSEGALLKLLTSRRGKIVTFDEMFAAVGGEGYIGDDTALRQMMRRMKTKLGPSGEHIVLERGKGYIIY